ncbi:MAG: TIM barrel protein [Pirellulales bacterium]|nr:TIM barrel protein [Pirellulales bacterium]
MKNIMDRRHFLKSSAALTAGFALTGGGSSRLWAAQAFNGAPHAEQIGWKLGIQAYSFNRFTFTEAVAKTASLGLRYLEFYPGQSLSKEKPKVKTDDSMTAEVRKEVKKILADAGVNAISYGVCKLTKDEEQSRKVFEFAKDMGIEILVAEPPKDAFDTLDKLCQEYKIKLALHNHPSPSIYWNYKTVLEVCKGRSEWIGACADTGHWMRSGISPLEAVKALEGRIVSFHLKDRNKYGKQGSTDVPWGTGKADIEGILREVKRQGFKGFFASEYETNWLNSLPDIGHCAGYFDGIAAEFTIKK